MACPRENESELSHPRPQSERGDNPISGHSLLQSTLQKPMDYTCQEFRPIECKSDVIDVVVGIVVAVVFVLAVVDGILHLLSFLWL